MVDALQCAVIGPQIKIIVDRAFRRQVFRHRTPLTASRQNVHEAVHYLAHDHRALAAAGLASWDQRFDQLPFRVSQITRIAQFATVITGAAFARPHRVTPSSNQATSLESQLILLIQELSGRTLRYGVALGRPLIGPADRNAEKQRWLDGGHRLTTDQISAKAYRHHDEQRQTDGHEAEADDFGAER